MAVALFACLVSSLTLAANGFRMPRKNEAGVQREDTVTVQAAAANCFLTSGYSVQGGCGHAPAVEPLVPCANLAQVSMASYSACEETVNIDVSGTGYKKFVQTQDEWDDMTELAVGAEGGGYGVSGSTSVNYLKSSKSNSESIAFFTGSSLINREVRVKNHSAMKALSTPKSLMMMSPSMFAQTYGLSYVAGIQYGGSFMGSFQLNQNSLTDKSELEGMIQLGTTGDAFSANGSAEFQTQRSSLSTSVSLWGRATWRGGSGIKQDYSTPEAIENMFNTWQDSVQQSPTQLKLYARRWIDVSEIMDSFMLYAMQTPQPPDWMDWMMKLQGASIPGVVDQEIGKETLHLTRLRQTTQDSQQYPDATVSSQTCLAKIDPEILKQLIIIEQLDEFKVEEISNQLLAGDRSFFTAPDFDDQVKACVNNR